MGPEHLPIQTVGVTGANGYVGSRIAAAVEVAGHRVIRLIRSPQSGSSDRYYALNSELSDDTLTGLEALIHCAWDMRLSDWAAVEATNVDGSSRLFQTAEKVGVKRSIFISSMSAFPGCESNYGKAKLAVENCIAGLNGVTIVRPGLIYGDHPGGVVGAMLNIAAKTPLLPMVGTGSFGLYTCHEQDLTALISYCISAADSSLPDRPLVAANPCSVEFRDVISHLAQRRLTFVPVPWRFLWAVLRLLESVGLRGRLKSDSLIGLVKSDPAPDFSVVGQLPVSFRPIIS